MPSVERLRELGISKTEYLYLQKNFNLKKKAFWKAESEEGVEKTTLNRFIDRAVAKARVSVGEGADITRNDLKQAVRSISRTRLYLSKEEIYHQNALSAIKGETGLLSKIYRWGGKTGFASSSWNGYTNKVEKSINGKVFRSSGFYNFGGVLVQFWTPKEGSDEQIIEMTNESGTKHEYIYRTGMEEGEEY